MTLGEGCLLSSLLCCCSVAQSCPTLCEAMDWSMPAFLPCPSLSPGACSNSCPLSQWCHPTIASSVVPFASCPPSFPALGSFPVSWLFASSGQSVGTSVFASVLPMNIQGCFPPLCFLKFICLFPSPCLGSRFSCCPPRQTKLSTFCGLLGKPLRAPGTFGAGRAFLVVSRLEAASRKEAWRVGNRNPSLAPSWLYETKIDSQDAWKLEEEKEKATGEVREMFPELHGARCCHFGKKTSKKFGKSQTRTCPPSPPFMSDPSAPTLVFVLGKSHGPGDLASYSPWGHKSWTPLSD